MQNDERRKLHEEKNKTIVQSSVVERERKKVQGWCHGKTVGRRKLKKEK